MQVHQSHFVQIQHGPGSGVVNLLRQCVGLPGFNLPNEPNSRCLAVRVPFNLMSFRVAPA